MSVFGMVLLAVSVSFSVYLSQSPKSVVAKKSFAPQVQHIKKEQLVKKVAKKEVKPVIKKQLAKAPVKKQKVEKKINNYALVKKNLKPKPRMVAYVGSVKLRANVDLSMDSWNNQHEQVETLNDNIGDDPVGAAAFENKRIREELAASGI